MLAVDRNAARVTEEKSEALLLKTVLRSERMNEGAIQCGAYDGTVQVAGVVAYKYRRPFYARFPLPGPVFGIYLGVVQYLDEDRYDPDEYSVSVHIFSLWNH